jgi:ribosomal protein L37AE/L43A
MRLTTDCPNCGSEIWSKRLREQDWFFCQSCQSMFFSNESLRENWPSLYRALAEKMKEAV